MYDIDAEMKIERRLYESLVLVNLEFWHRRGADVSILSFPC